MKKRVLKYAVCVCTGVAVWLFWWLLHPEVLAFQEQYQLWQGTWGYLAEHLGKPGGLSAYLGEFVTQMNVYPALGAALIALLQATLLWRRPWPMLVLVVALNWMMGDENLLPSFLIAVVLLVAGVNAVLCLRSAKMRAAAAVAMLPLWLWACAGTHYRIPHAFLQAPGFNAEKSEVLDYDRLVKNQAWDAIVRKAERTAPSHPLGLQALNLALAKRQQLGERLFEFPQTGLDALMYPWRNNCVDNVISSEVAWHTGLVNTAFRYAFDSQEAIPDKRKSARLMKRMAECCIVNGDYKAARKYLNRLKHTLFYRIWAERAESYLGDEGRIAQHPIWGEKRALRFKQDFLFTYPELHKIYAMLAAESNGRNKIAWDYFNAAALLKGDLQTFVGMAHYGQELFGVTVLPRYEQEAWAMFWTMSHPDFNGMPVNIAPNIQKRTMQFAQAFSQHQGKLDGFERAYADTYWTYYFRRMLAGTPQTDGTTSATAHN